MGCKTTRIETVFQPALFVCLLALTLPVALAAQEFEQPNQDGSPAGLPESPVAGPGLPTGTAPDLSVFSVLKFSGRLLNSDGSPQSGTVGVTFAFYSEQSGSAPLWMETQNVTLDSEGRYSVLLGAASAEGLPLEVFSAGEARWLSVQSGIDAEQPRIMLVSVPYAMKAMEADLLGGRSADEFATSEQLDQLDEAVRQVEDQISSKPTDTTDTTRSLDGTAITGGSASIATKTMIPVFTAEHAIADSVIQEASGNIGINVSPVSGRLHVATSTDQNAIFGTVTSTSGTRSGVKGVSASGYGVWGDATATTGDHQGVFGSSASPNGEGVFGRSSSTTGANSGVRGHAESTAGTGVYGWAKATTGTTWGVKGIADSTGGRGVYGEATDAGGIGGLFKNSGAGTDNAVISGGAASTITFTVDTEGDVVANSFSGDGSLLTGVDADDADTLDTLDSTAFAQLAAANTFTAAQTISADFTVSTTGGGFKVIGDATSPNILGGYSGNSITAGSVGTTLSGGGKGGFINQVTDDYGTVSGGRTNQAGDNAGTTDDAEAATVGGGVQNTASGRWSTVGGGLANTASGGHSTVGGGSVNVASGGSSTVGGGLKNTASGGNSTVGGGNLNTASGLYSTVPGGLLNVAAGNYGSFAAGRRAKANHDGAFVWGDNSNFDIASTVAAEFTARATGGFRFITAIDGVGAATKTLTIDTSGNVSADGSVASDTTLTAGTGVTSTAGDITATAGNVVLDTGDVYVKDSANGVILKSPDGTCWRVTVDNAGALSAASITCP